MQLFITALSAIIILTGIMTTFYLLYCSLINLIHPTLARAWFIGALLLMLLALLSDIIVVKKQASKSVFEEDYLSSSVNFEKPFKLVEVK